MPAPETHPDTHDAYLAPLPADQRHALEALRADLRALLPEAEEVMPGFRIGKKVVAGYAAFSRHLGIYPHSGSIVPQMADDLDRLGFKHSKSGILFTPDRPVPLDIVARLVTLRRAEIGA